VEVLGRESCHQRLAAVLITDIGEHDEDLTRAIRFRRERKRSA